MSVPRARMLDLVKVCYLRLCQLIQLTMIQARCQLFSTTFNPEGIRTGNKILRQRLRGPSLVSYYPGRLPGIRDLQKAFAPLDLLCYDEKEWDRLEHIAAFVSTDPYSPFTPDQLQIEGSWQGCAEEEEDSRSTNEYVDDHMSSRQNADWEQGKNRRSAVCCVQLLYRARDRVHRFPLAIYEPKFYGPSLVIFRLSGVPGTVPAAPLTPFRCQNIRPAPPMGHGFAPCIPLKMCQRTLTLLAELITSPSSENS